MVTIVVATALFAVGTTQAQVGALIWEDDFADIDNWIILTGNGDWGWGNGELEFYSEDNVDIAAVAGEPGNTALRLTARQESGPGIVDQDDGSGQIGYAGRAPLVPAA